MFEWSHVRFHSKMNSKVLLNSEYLTRHTLGFHPTVQNVWISLQSIINSIACSREDRKFGNCVTVHRPPAARPSAPQAYQCLLSHFLATLRAQEKADCRSMLSSIDSCQNRVSADQYHLTVSRAQVSTHRVRVFFWSYPLTSYHQMLY